jgi:hypothetical protein
MKILSGPIFRAAKVGSEIFDLLNASFGVSVNAFVIEPPDGGFHDLLSASQSSLEFWDNPLDDEDWNDA